MTMTTENWREELVNSFKAELWSWGLTAKDIDVNSFVDSLLSKERNKVIEKLEAMAFENDDGYKIELFINWDKAKEELKHHE